MSSTAIRWGAALLALGFIAAVLVVTSASDSNDEDRSRPETAAVFEPVTQTEYSNIYLVGAKRGAPVPLTHNHAEEVADSPSWSDEGRIAFAETECERCPSKLFATDGEGSATQRIPSDVRNVFQPAWSPDGRKVALARPGSGIFVVTVRDGSARRVSSGASDGAPAWSPDGETILFHPQVTATNWDIYAVRPSGGELRRLTHGSRQQLHPTWSPDAARIAFAEQ